jgi:predicted RNA binding protein YcfA (HicA-like mRNA interferase family)
MAKYEKRYDSLGGLIEDALKPAPSYVYRGSRGYSPGFHSIPSFEEAAELAFNWTDGVRRMSKIRADIAQGKQWRKVIYRRPNMPGSLIMGDYLAGHPEPYAAIRRKPDDNARRGKSPVIKVFVNLACSAAISNSALEARGAAVLAMTDAIEAAGYAAEVVVGSHSQVGRNTYDYRITVKRAGDKLNVNSVAFAMGNPDTFRRFIFGAREAEFEISSATPIEWTDIPKDAIHIGCMNTAFGHKWKTPEDSRRWIQEQLKAQGINVELA